MSEEVTATIATEVEQPAPEPAPARIVCEGVREKMIPLECPVEFEGKLHEAIKIRRASGKEVREYLERLRTSAGDIVPPMIDCPIEVWNALDADDQQTVDEAAKEFTPKRVQALFQAAVAFDAAAEPAK